ncbi:hypothetical protein N9Y60_04875 [Crocinitomicaceae bacterium]|nr:hypothetical protein [Crocinitomicaceae bacterium]MDB3907021.1 hypothetical protein [Crocinitomicaceae bacterium]
MAGGKETPRQKMIGMMYLVLTALLALNVSKSILDAFVAIEENTQKGNIAQVQRGNGYVITVRSEKGALEATDPKGNAQKIKNIDAALDQMDNINKATAEMIVMIDKIKLDILKKSGEDVSKYKDNDELTILWKKYDKSSAESMCQPIRMNLMAVSAKDQYDIPMHEIIGEDIKKPSPGKHGMKLWKGLIEYRRKIMDLAGSYTWAGKEFKVDVKDINSYKDNADLTKQIQAMVEGEDVNPDDRETLSQIYNRLTKQEKNKVHDVKDVHWIGMTFDHAPLVAALASLSSLQSDILTARADALSLWKAKISTGEYSFDKIAPIAIAPSSTRSGEEFEVKVMMAAFDSQNQPKVKVEGDEKVYTGEGGQAIIKRSASGASVDLKGTITILNKQGAEKTREWTASVPVITPSGAIELTELNVLYRGYPNKVEASGSGYETISLTGTSVSVSKSGSGYIVKPTGGKSATLSVTGRNANGDSKVLKKGTYRVSNLPDPVLFWGGSKSGVKGSRSSRALLAKYTPEIPLKASFKVTKWTASAPGLKGAPPQGMGGSLAPAGALISAAPPGTSLSITATVVGPDGIARQIGGSWPL